MSSTFAEGDRVRVVDRDVTAADVKSQLFFEHYRGLVGNVRKIYADSTIAVAIAMDDLPVSHSKRHNEVTDWVRGRELEKLSEEAKNKLNAGDKKFAVPYAILVSINDLLPAGADDHSGKAAGLPETPVRKSMAQLEEEEARHLDAVQRKQD
jgi:hypothetical protein